MHEHKEEIQKECEHKNLKHCSKCDVVYCEDCKKEWKQSVWSNIDVLYTPTPTPVTWVDFDITC